MTFPYGPLRIDIVLLADGYQWRVGYGSNTLTRAKVCRETAEEALAEAKAWCAGFKAKFEEGR